MNNPTEYRSLIPAMTGRVAGAALGLAILMVPAILASVWAQAQTQTERVLYSFAGTPDGAHPYAGLVRDTHGNLYGSTIEGGASTYGTVFEVDPAGNETVLYSFTAATEEDALPTGLARDRQGNLYGTTPGGGSFGHGTVFRVDAAGSQSVLYSFTGTNGDGAVPQAGLVLDPQGNLYGTTEQGGDLANCYDAGCGTVFELDTTGQETVLYTFTGTAGDGYWPAADLLVRDAQGNLYGTTSEGGASNYGTVFRVDSAGQETVLHSFTETGGDGAYPETGLIEDAEGNLYGTTIYGGAFGYGMVFKLDPTGEQTVLHSFAGTAGDGIDPAGGLVQDAQGNLYGSTSAGGASGYGTVFKVDPAGNETVLYSFKGTGGDGAYPAAGLVLDALGNLYGTTRDGGANGFGMVFKLAPLLSTTTTLSSSPNPSTYGQAVTLTAIVTSKLGAPPDGETVSFMDGKTTLGTGTLSRGSASLTTSTLQAGASSVRAVYAGDSNLSGSTSKAVRQVVSKATTTTTLASSLNPSNLGQSVTFTASVAPEFTVTLTGSVTFYDGTMKLKAVSVSGGTAQVTTSKLTAGTHSITATYNGSASFISSSASLTQTVNIVPTLISIAVAPVDSLLAAGASEQFIAYGSYSDGSVQNVTSLVTWKSSKTDVATIVSGGLATGVAAGTTRITARSGKVYGSASLTVN
jgi:uncharacterized repeat protein (TIGR03803 family)